MVNKQRRKELVRRYGGLYRRATGFDIAKCAYCNAPRECTDHVPAISLLDSIDVKQYIKQGGKFLYYPACNECNRIMNNSDRVSFSERLSYLSYKYIKKLDKMELWTPHEVNQMGRMMQSYIESHQHKIQQTIAKLETIEEKRLNTDYDAFN